MFDINNEDEVYKQTTTVALLINKFDCLGVDA